jgi:hypothetical protein
MSVGGSEDVLRGSGERNIASALLPSSYLEVRDLETEAEETEPTESDFSDPESWLQGIVPRSNASALAPKASDSERDTEALLL